jgi:uncharacterized spore protein YtfJ
MARYGCGIEYADFIGVAAGGSENMRSMYLSIVFVSVCSVGRDDAGGGSTGGGRMRPTTTALLSTHSGKRRAGVFNEAEN